MTAPINEIKTIITIQNKLIYQYHSTTYLSDAKDVSQLLIKLLKFLTIKNNFVLESFDNFIYIKLLVFCVFGGYLSYF